MEALEIVIQTPWALLLITACLGLCIGSFLNVVILRLPQMMKQTWRSDCHAFLEIEDSAPEASRLTLSTPPSTCPKCQHRIRAWENIPVLSYLLLRGRCSGCQTRISPRYPIIEAVTAGFSVLTVWLLGPTWASALGLLLVWALVALAVIDFDTQLLPDSITLPLLWLGLIANQWSLFASSESALWGAVGGYLSLWSVYWGFKLLTGKEGMGHGDFKLLAALGAWLGWQSLLIIILLSSLVGAVVGIALIVFRSMGREVPMPFGPYLAAAGLLALWFGPELQQAWYSFLGV